MDDYRPLEHQVFVLRLWREGTSRTWRGQIVHLPEQETAAFARWEQALAFVGRFVGGADLSADDERTEPPAAAEGAP